ncbi:PREDICTED: BTB/POZ [Prunus dulcis]|uniref:PREDICTED: BTB/POZ n=1 Tax=Prunus dulcis TaxID=3755 RepID=A0A5E4FTE1_PRUDU|nr:hypothetical protein L3X38_020918 [Prunus dulcis]VVA30712.1 PREDICTED: BTB/POZ [Prunus dulcis]
MALVSGRPNILSETEKSLEGISFWTWPNFVVALKQCQDLLPASISPDIGENPGLPHSQAFLPICDKKDDVPGASSFYSFKFLFHYHQSKSIGATTPADKRKITEVCLKCLIEAPFLAKVRITNAQFGGTRTSSSFQP